MTFKVENSFHFNTQTLFIQIRMPVSVTTDSLPDGNTGAVYDETLTAFAEKYNYTWSIVEGALPDGLDLDENTGTISGTPTTAGTFSFTVQVDDGLGTDTRALTILIQ
jgi:hypothetical protein